jgi:NAD(P)-dependent dehydrogenase (short-subunit alcohol dehydrogenase family)
VTSVAPGSVITERPAAKPAENGAALRKQRPFRQVGTPEEAAVAVLYLASATCAILDRTGASPLRT